MLVLLVCHASEQPAMLIDKIRQLPARPPLLYLLAGYDTPDELTCYPPQLRQLLAQHQPAARLIRLEMVAAEQLADRVASLCHQQRFSLIWW